MPASPADIIARHRLALAEELGVPVERVRIIVGPGKGRPHREIPEDAMERVLVLLGEDVPVREIARRLKIPYTTLSNRLFGR